MGLYKRLLGFLKPHIFIFLIGFLFIGITTLTDGISLSMLIPLADKVLGGKEIIIDKELPNILESLIGYINTMSRLKLLNIMGASILILVFLKGLSHYGQQYFMQNLGSRVIRDIRIRMFEKYHSLSLDFFNKRKTGDLISRIIYDPSTIQNTVSNTLTDLIFQTLRAIMFSIIVFTINFKLSLLIFLLAPFIALPIIHIGRVLRKVSRWTQEKMSDISSTLYETISGVRIIKIFNMQNYEINKFRDYNQRFFKLKLKSVKRVAAISPISEFFGTVGAVAILVIGGRQVISGTLSFGIFLFYLGSLLSLVRPINRLARIHGVNQKALAAAERIFYILDMQSTIKENPAANVLEKYNKDIVYADVYLSYDDKKTYVLKNINFRVKKGQIVALVGPTGSGKSSLINLLPRFYDPSEGKILIDGKDIRDYTLHSLRDKISMVTQEVILFNDTIKANIGYGSGNISEEEITSAAKTAFAHGFISSMPYGYNTVVGDRGIRLSGGEKQRIAIARAIIKKAPILILDEATSHLDAESTIIVQKAIDKLIVNKTVFVIAHRLSTVKNADKILVINEGHIIQEGTHSSLLNQGGLYEKLYSLQFKDIPEEKINECMD